MKQILKFFAVLTLFRSLLRLSKLDTVHYEMTANQMNQTRSAIYMACGFSNELIERVANVLKVADAQISKYQHRIDLLEAKAGELKQHNDLLVNEVTRLADVIENKRRELMSIETPVEVAEETKL